MPDNTDAGGGQLIRPWGQGFAGSYFYKSSVLALERLANGAIECAINQEERG